MLLAAFLRVLSRPLGARFDNMRAFKSKFTATDGAIEGIHDLVASVSSPLSSFVNSLNASAEEARTLISGTDGWLGELEDGILLRLVAFDSAHR